MRSLLEILAENVRRYRGDESQEALAKRASVAVEVVRRIEQKRSWPELKNIEAIARALRVEPADLFYKGEPPAPVIVKEKASLRDALRTVRELLVALDDDDTDSPLVRELLESVKKRK